MLILYMFLLVYGIWKIILLFFFDDWFFYVDRILRLFEDDEFDDIINISFI